MYIKRKIFPDLHKHLSKKQITVITGMRRTGKTTLLKHLMSVLKTKNKLYLDLERLDTRQLFNEKNYDNIMRALITLGLDTNKKIYLFIDEIQLAPNIVSVIKYLYDNYSVKFVLSGSSSYYLKNMFTESLAGRKKVFTLKTLTFNEFLRFKGINPTTPKFPSEKFSQYKYEQLKHYYSEYIEFGGFPEIALTDSNEEKTDLLNDIVHSYIYFDLKSITDIRRIENIEKLLKLLSSRIGSKLVINKISSLTKISRETLNNYLRFLEDTFVVKRINVFAKNPNREITKTQKLYFTDNGILKIFGLASSGALFENSIFNQLSHYGDLQYYSRKDGKGIDFLLNDWAFEVKENPDIYDLKNLKRISKKIGIENYALVGKYRIETFDDYIWGESI